MMHLTLLLYLTGSLVKDESGMKCKTQKKYLMVTYRILWEYMVETYDGAIVDGKVRFSETKLREVFPKHIKQAMKRTKSMCCCQCCTDFNDKYQCLTFWRRKFIERTENKIADMAEGTEKSELEADLEDYQAHISKDDTSWNASQRVGCARKLIPEMDGTEFTHFSCILKCCTKCPPWEDVIHRLERECTDPIKYSYFGKQFRCPDKTHNDRFIDADSEEKPYCLKCRQELQAKEEEEEKKRKEEELKKKPMKRKRKTEEEEGADASESRKLANAKKNAPELKYKQVRMQHTMPMNEFMKKVESTTRVFTRCCIISLMS